MSKSGLLRAFEAISKQPARYSDGNYEELATRLAIHYDTVRKAARLYRLGQGPARPEAPTLKAPEPWSVSGELQKRRDNALVKAQGEKIQALTRELEKTSAALDQALALSEPMAYRPARIRWDHRTANEGLVVTQWSDWHVEKRIDRRVMNGLNEYNPDIAKRRSEKMVENLLKLVRKERQDLKIPQLLINLGGDAINNYLHEGDEVDNYLTPLEATIYAKQLLGNALTTVATHGEFKKITVLCQRGNHPRLTKKMQSSVDYKMNLEMMIYHFLRQEFSDALFEWHIPESELAYVEVEGRLIRGFHGHQIGYQGGVGGLTIPLTKKILYWDKTRQADFNLMHHFHTFSLPAKNCSLNGSLVGYDPFAQGLGFAYEPPLQAFMLLDKKRGWTGRFPIHCE